MHILPHMFDTYGTTMLLYPNLNIIVASNHVSEKFCICFCALLSHSSSDLIYCQIFRIQCVTIDTGRTCVHCKMFV